MTGRIRPLVVLAACAAVACDRTPERAEPALLQAAADSSPPPEKITGARAPTPFVTQAGPAPRGADEAARQGPTAEAPPSVQDSAYAALPVTPGSIALVVAPIDTTITFGAWRTANPNELVRLRTPTGSPEEVVCRTSIGRYSIGDLILDRLTVFVPPRMPKGELLPADSVNVAERHCRLGAVWLEAEARDTIRSHAFADSVAATLTRMLGEPVPEFLVLNIGQAGSRWRRLASWKTPTRTIVMGVQPRRPELGIRPMIVLAAYAKNSGIFADLDEYVAASRIEFAEPDPNAHSAIARLDSAIQWANLSSVASDIRALRDHLGDTTSKTGSPPLDSALVRVVKLVRDSASQLDSVRRAAAYLAGDIAVHEYLGLSQRWTSGGGFRIVELLKAEGLAFAYDEMEGVHSFDRKWLREAYRASPGSNAGRSAFIELLPDGFSDIGVCEDATALRRSVIEYGEAALREGHSDPLIHYHVADAYATLWSFSMLEIVDPEIRETLEREARVARQRAIQHYRLALQGVRDRSIRRSAWTAAMKAMIGVPNGTTYYCSPRD